MSHAFCLPVAVSILPRRSLTVAIIALHCLPLPVLVVAIGGAGAWVLAAIAGLSLVLELYKQRLAGAATKLEGTITDDWLLYRNGPHPSDQCSRVQLIDKVDCGGFVLLLMAQDGRKFRLVVRSGEQARDQLHRLRVILINRRLQLKDLKVLGSSRSI